MWLIKAEGWETKIKDKELFLWNDEEDSIEEAVEIAAERAFNDWWGEHPNPPCIFEVYKDDKFMGKYKVEVDFEPSFDIRKEKE